MKILSIDPGTKQSAYLILDNNTISDFGIIENNELRQKLLTIQCDVLAIEMFASYGMKVGASVFDTCVWIGRFVQTITDRNIPFEMIYRKQVKMQVCGKMQANDSSIRAKMIEIFGEQGTKKNKGATYGISKDIWSALAIAYTYKMTKSTLN